MMLIFMPMTIARRSSPRFTFSASKCKSRRDNLTSKLCCASEWRFLRLVQDKRQPRLQDYLGGFAVSVHGADEAREEFKQQHDDYSAIMTKALGID